MARFNEILTGRHNRFLQKFLSMKGGPPSAQLSTEIASQFQLDDADALDLRYLASVRSYGALVTVIAGGVGNSGAIRLRNPVNSGVIITVEKVTLFSQPAVSAIPVLTRGPLGNGDFPTVLGTTAPRDSRIGGGQSASISSTTVGVISGIILARALLAANAQYDVINDIHQEIVVMPNDSVTIFETSTNQAMQGGFFWRERALEEGEVNP